MTRNEDTTIGPDGSLERMLRSVFFILFVPWLIWYFANRRAEPRPQRQVRRQPVTDEAPRPASNNPTTNARNPPEQDSNDSSILKYTRKPPNSIPTSGKSHLIHIGILPFKYTLAATYEMRAPGSSSEDASGKGKSSSVQLRNRKDRARMFTKLFDPNRSGESLPPPGRGSNIIVSVPVYEIHCPKLRRALFLLGTYFNLFLLISLIDEEDNESSENKATSKNYKDDKLKMDELIIKMRGGNNEVGVGLPEEIIPPHRIVGTRSISSKVAFVRQLPKLPAFVLDFEAEMSTQLSRFGFKVLTYSPSKKGSSISGLGAEMLM